MKNCFRPKRIITIVTASIVITLLALLFNRVLTYTARKDVIQALADSSKSDTFQITRGERKDIRTSKTIEIISPGNKIHDWIRFNAIIGPYDRLERMDISSDHFAKTNLPHGFIGISHFPELKLLWIENRMLNNLEVQSIGKLINLEELNISNTGIPAERVLGIVKNMPNLMVLDVSKISFTPQQLSSLLNITKKLTSLTSYSCDLSDRHADCFFDLNLTNLNVGGNDLGNKSLNSIGTCRNLNVLNISGNKRPVNEFKGLSKLSKLQILFLTDTNVNNTNLQALNKNQSIIHLDFSRTTVEKKTFEVLLEMPQLKSFYCLYSGEQSLPLVKMNKSKRYPELGIERNKKFYRLDSAGKWYFAQ